MNIQSCVCVTPWVWRGFYWIQGTLYEIADQTYCQDTVLELCWHHWKWEITQISIWEEDNQKCNLSGKLYPQRPLCYLIFKFNSGKNKSPSDIMIAFTFSLPPSFRSNTTQMTLPLVFYFFLSIRCLICILLWAQSSPLVVLCSIFPQFA